MSFCSNRLSLKSPSTLLPHGPSWISTCFLCAKSIQAAFVNTIGSASSLCRSLHLSRAENLCFDPNNLQSALSCVVSPSVTVAAPVEDIHHCYATLIASSKCCSLYWADCVPFNSINTSTTVAAPSGSLQPERLTIVCLSGFVHSCRLP